MKAVKSHNSVFTHRDIRPSVSRSFGRGPGGNITIKRWTLILGPNKQYTQPTLGLIYRKVCEIDETI
ncbi:hypothetical protein PAEAM_40740 [Paenibacillus sp. GM1FR]|nr:hypothetical protein PAEAM_40740 [Paenibacillus sp. GM1FR]